MFGQGHGGALRRGHHPNRAAAVGALQVSRSSQLRGLHAQSLLQGEGVPRAVPAVRLVPPLHHRSLPGGCLVVTGEDHGLEEHRKLLLLWHCDMHTITDTH